MLTRRQPSNGGQFEFLPVTVISGHVALKAVLRVGMHAGFESGTALIGGFLGTINKGDFTGKSDRLVEALKFTYGMEVGVFAT
jgi:hypothetical protein